MERNLGNLAVEEVVCRLHARSPMVGRTNRRTAVSVILGGSFHVRAPEGEAVVGPGALLLKNAGGVQEYRHIDDGGDHSITFELDDAFVEAACASFAHRGRRTFAQLCIPASARTAAAVALVERARRDDRDAVHDAALAVTTLAFTADWQPTPPRAPTPAQIRRVVRVLRHVDEHPADDCSLETLAAIAGLSTFHFARVFRVLSGQTPRQYVIAARLRAAARALSSTRRPVIEVALDAGFADLSHFTTSFRRAFGVSPRRYRAATLRSAS
jgi:AraC family transcriptional regulator